MDQALAQHPIVFFDGVCALCNRLLRVLVRADKDAVLRFAPIQGETAKALLPPLPEDSQRWSMYYVDGTGVYSNSDAALRICRRLGGAIGFLAWLRVIPRFVRDLVYRWIARNRYRWFGRYDACPAPPADLRARLLP